MQTVSGQPFGGYLKQHVFGPLAPAGKPSAPLVWAAAALALDGLSLWLCLIYAPARFDTHLFVIIRQFPDVGVSLVGVLALAVLWPVPRTGGCSWECGPGRQHSDGTEIPGPRHRQRRHPTRVPPSYFLSGDS